MLPAQPGPPRSPSRSPVARLGEVARRLSISSRPSPDSSANPSPARSRSPPARSPGRRSSLLPHSFRLSGSSPTPSPHGTSAATTWSVAVTALGPEYDDMYINQLPLSYGGHSVYVGHRTGRYLFYYEPPASGLPGGVGCAGWCLSRLLGSGHSPLRLRLVPPFARRPSSQSTALVETGQGAHPGSRRSSSPVPSTTASTTRPCSAGSVRLVSEAEAGVHWVPHRCSSLEQAAQSGDAKAVMSLAKVYRARYTSAQLWLYSVGHKQWQSYSAPEQEVISKAWGDGKQEVMFKMDGRQVIVDLRKMVHITDTGAAPMRRLQRTLFGGRDDLAEPLLTGDRDQALQDWAHAAVWLSSGQLTMAAADTQMLELLVAEGLVDPTLWDPPAVTSASKVLVPERRPLLNTVLTAFTWGHVCPAGSSSSSPPLSWSTLLASSVNHRRSSSPVPTTTRRSSAPSAPAVGSGVGLTSVTAHASEGLLDFVADPQGAVREGGAPPACGPLEFCAALPNSPVAVAGAELPELAILLLCHEALMKSAELQRQHAPFNPHHVHAVFLYTSLMQGQGGGAGHLFCAVNRAIRQGGTALDFWRPLIWYLDEALRALPPCHETGFRGLPRPPPDLPCAAGDVLRWPSFSLAVAAPDAVGWQLRFKLKSADCLRDVSWFTAQPTQRQFLLCRDATFRISTVAQSPTSQPGTAVEVVCRDPNGPNDDLPTPAIMVIEPTITMEAERRPSQAPSDTPVPATQLPPPITTAPVSLAQERAPVAPHRPLVGVAEDSFSDSSGLGESGLSSLLSQTSDLSFAAEPVAPPAAPRPRSPSMAHQYADAADPTFALRAALRARSPPPSISPRATPPAMHREPAFHPDKTRPTTPRSPLRATPPPLGSEAPHDAPNDPAATPIDCHRCRSPLRASTPLVVTYW